MKTIESYRREAKEILMALGKVRRTDNIYDDNEGVEQACEYQGYGLSIGSYHLPGYVDDDITKRYISDINIYYEKERVLDSYGNEIKRGIWEEIFNELYDKLPVLISQKEDEERKAKQSEELFKSTIKPLIDRRIYNITDSIKIVSQKRQSSRINNCGTYLDDYYYNVEVDGRTVFGAIQYDSGEFEYYYYKEGPWEAELKQALYRDNEKKAREYEERGYSYLKKLRDLK